MSIRLKFEIRDLKDKRSAKWDETVGGDYDAASLALLAVAMGDDDVRRAIARCKFTDEQIAAFTASEPK